MNEDNELMHYGVLGMKWGVRRANKNLANATTSERRNKALNQLSAHRGKSVKKVAKLDAKINKLQKRADKDAMRNSYKAASMASKSAKLNKKANSVIRIKSLDGIRNWRSARLNNKSEKMRKNIEHTKSALAKNQKMRDIFSSNIASIDKTLIENGRRVLDA